jgi:hypothetical protein
VNSKRTLRLHYCSVFHSIRYTLTRTLLHTLTHTHKRTLTHSHTLSHTYIFSPIRTHKHTHTLQGLLALFDQLLSRVDHCYKRLSSLPSSTSSKSQGQGFSKNHTLQISASPTTQSPHWGYLNGVRALNGTPGSNATGAFLKNHMRCRSYAFINGFNGFIVHFDAYSFSPLLFSSPLFCRVTWSYYSRTSDVPSCDTVSKRRQCGRAPRESSDVRSLLSICQ